MKPICWSWPATSWHSLQPSLAANARLAASGHMRSRELLERIQIGQGTQEDLDLLFDLGDTMKVASLCAFGGRAPYPVLTAIDHFPAEFRSKLRQ